MQYHALHDNDNMFVAGQERFAVQNDEITYQRIVGRLRIGLYAQCAADELFPFDYKVDYGIALVHGEYASDGSWSSDTDLPNPADSKDDPEKWLWKDSVILNLGSRYQIFSNTDAGAPRLFELCDPEGNPYGAATIHGIGREYVPSTDFIGPQYSFIDIKPRRKAKYEEKLGIITVVQTNDGAEQTTVSLNHNLRVLTSKWG